MDAVTPQLERHQTWPDANGERIRTQETDYLEADLADGSLQSFRQIPDSLDALALYHGIRGTLEAIAALFAGDFLVLDYRVDADEPGISLWNHELSGEDTPSTDLIAESFPEFLELIKIET